MNFLSFCEGFFMKIKISKMLVKLFQMNGMRDGMRLLIVVIECHNSTQVILNSSIRAEVFRQFIQMRFIMIRFRTYGRGEATSFDTVIPTQLLS